MRTRAQSCAESTPPAASRSSFVEATWSAIAFRSARQRIERTSAVGIGFESGHEIQIVAHRGFVGAHLRPLVAEQADALRGRQTRFGMSHQIRILRRLHRRCGNSLCHLHWQKTGWPLELSALHVSGVSKLGNPAYRVRFEADRQRPLLLRGRE